MKELESLKKIANFDQELQPEYKVEHVFYTGDVDRDDNGAYVYPGSTVFEDYHTCREYCARVYASVYCPDDNELQIDWWENEGRGELFRVNNDDELWPVERVHGPVG